MYAVLETGSKQYRVSAGDTLEIERLPVEAGQSFTFDRVLLVNADGKGTVGVIPTVTKPFCGDCDRVRLTAEGDLRTCLFATREFDLLAALLVFTLVFIPISVGIFVTVSISVVYRIGKGRLRLRDRLPMYE